MSFQGPNDENPEITVNKEDSLKVPDFVAADKPDARTPSNSGSGMTYTRSNPYKSRVAAKATRRRIQFFLIIAGVIVLGMLTGVGGYWYLHVRAPSPETEASAPTQAVSPVTGTPCPLCGLPLEKLPDNRPLAVMIDNLNLARPQSGLDQADLVYEAPVEGGLTRLMPIFYHQRPGKIGPIRSARPYFIALAQENQAVYIHCGGSPEALQMLTSSSIASVNEFGAAKYFWRSTQRKEPQNLYSSSDQLEQAARTRGIVISKTPPAWQFLLDENAPAGGLPAETINLYYGSSSNEVRYIYNAAEKVYLRYMGGQSHIDADSGKQLAAANVVVQYVGGRVLDSEGRLQLGVVGSGKAIIYTRGVKIEATWSKSAAGSRTVFKNQQGAEEAFAPGTTWIQLATPNVKVY